MTEQNKDNCCDCNLTDELLENIPDNEELEEISDIFKSIADPTRLKILFLLKNGELCVCEIFDALDKSQSTVSHHLHILKKEKIINGRKEGKWIYYKLNNPEILEKLAEFSKVIE
ncbi:ArsR/SmtB family transcription factor [Methanobrevibacter sp.]|uniref:ArsR/SmtB family transcription factor n=1 Tax=Methanobrevibacter sp. TaxID=66852 RepID=UPI00389092E7